MHFPKFLFLSSWKKLVYIGRFIPESINNFELLLKAQVVEWFSTTWWQYWVFIRFYSRWLRIKSSKDRPTPYRSNLPPVLFRNSRRKIHTEHLVLWWSVTLFQLRHCYKERRTTLPKTRWKHLMLSAGGQNRI